MQKDITLSIGYVLLFLLFVTLTCGKILELMGVSLAQWTLPLGFVLTILFFSLLSRKWGEICFRQSVRLYFSVLLIVALSLLLGGYVYDYAYDGQSYHQPIIRSLMWGWNPVYEPHCPYTAEWGCSSFVDHYPKAMEMLCAIFAKFVGNIECGKAVNLLLVASSFCFMYSFLKVYLTDKYGVLVKFWLAILLTLSPVTLSQVFTYYVDFTLYAYLLIGFSSIYLYAGETTCPQKYSLKGMEISLVVVMVVSLAVATKLTVAFWVGVFYLVAFVFLIQRKEVKKFFYLLRSAVVGGMFGLLILGYHPYVTHLQQGYHLLHPFMGEKAVDVEAIQAEALADCGRVEAVVKSLFSRPGEGGADSKQNYLPDVQSVIASGKADVRIGGGGLLFIELLLLTPILLLLTWRSSPASTLRCLVFIMLLVLSLFILPNGWWVRFTPFTYLIPVFAILHFFKSVPEKMRGFKVAVVAVMTVNMFVTGGVALLLMQMHRSKVNYLTDVLKQSKEVRIQCHNHTFQSLMEERGVVFQKVESAPQQLIYPGPAVFCYSEEWNTTGLKMSDYPLLRYSNIKDGFISPCCESLSN